MPAAHRVRPANRNRLHVYQGPVAPATAGPSERTTCVGHQADEVGTFPLLTSYSADNSQLIVQIACGVLPGCLASVGALRRSPFEEVVIHHDLLISSYVNIQSTRAH